jgi:hypothetical protein
MKEQSTPPQRTPERPEFDYHVTIVDEPEYYAYETQEGRFGIDWPSENTADPVRLGEPSLSREAVLEALHEEALREESMRNSRANHAKRNAELAQRYPEPQRDTEWLQRRPNQERQRYWSIEQSAEAVNGLIGIDEKLRHEVHSLADGSIGVIKAIKEKLADECSYDPAERLTPERIRSIVGAPEDPALLDSWRTSFYEPYRRKYRAQDHPDSY